MTFNMKNIFDSFILDFFGQTKLGLSATEKVGKLENTPNNGVAFGLLMEFGNNEKHLAYYQP